MADQAPDGSAAAPAKRGADVEHSTALDAISSQNPTLLPPPIESALERVPDQEARRILSVALSKTTFGFGPDPETAKTIAQTEMHEEECRLKAYQASLQNREQQSHRDHEFRKKRLNHQTALTVAILVVTISGVGAGLGLTIVGNSSIGNPVLIASFTMLSGLAGKLLSGRDKD